MGAGAWEQLTGVAVEGEKGRYRAHIGPVWDLAVVPQGGAIAVVAARAMAAELGQPDQALRSLSVVFAGQVACGEVVAEVELLRAGRSMSQLCCTVRNPDREAGLTAVAVFGAPRRGFQFTDLTYPDVPAPDGLRSFRDGVPDDVDFEFPRPPMPFWDEVIDARQAVGRAPWDAFAEGPAEAAFWYRIDDPPLTDDGRLDPLTSIVLCDTMPGAVGQKIGHDDPWFGPSADLTVHLFDRARPGWLLAHNRARHAGDGYASVEMALWDPSDRALVAYATQVMFFAFGV
jgi:hypothetical protein